MAGTLDLEGQLCSVCWEGNDFRVLQCGHGFCLECLEALYMSHGHKIICPMDRAPDERPPESLPTPNQFQGRLYIQTVDDEVYVNMNQLIDAQIKQRKCTIKHLRRIFASLTEHEFNCAGAKIGGSALGIGGAIMGIVGISLSLTGVGAVAGVPLAATGFGLAAAGGVTAGVTMVVEGILKKIGIDEIQEELQRDYFKAEQLKVLLYRAANDSHFARRLNIYGLDIVYIGSLIPRMTKLGLTTAAGIRIAFGIGRAATTTALHVAGLVFAAALIPLDIAQLIISSIKIHKKEPSKVVQDISDLADVLEKELKLFLIDGGFFNLIYTTDGCWAYIEVYATKKNAFEQQKERGFLLAELAEFGNIVHRGSEPDVPNRVRNMIQNEWYNHYDEYLAEVLEESLSLGQE